MVNALSLVSQFSHEPLKEYFTGSKTSTNKTRKIIRKFKDFRVAFHDFDFFTRLHQRAQELAYLIVNYVRVINKRVVTSFGKNCDPRMSSIFGSFLFRISFFVEDRKVILVRAEKISQLVRNVRLDKRVLDKETFN